VTVYLDQGQFFAQSIALPFVSRLITMPWTE
jgi:hypothetical protein